jgi:simple sugar transport system substrate-binding protein
MRRYRKAGVALLLVMLATGLLVSAVENPLKSREPESRSGGDTLRFAMVTIATSVQFWVPVFQGFKDAAAMLGVEVQHLGPPGGEIQEVADTLETLLAAGIDGVAAFVAVPGSLDVVIEKYVAAGIPISILATGDEAAEKYNLAYIGQDNYAAGISWGKKVLDLLGGPGNATGKRVAFLTENPGQTSLEDRMDAGRTILEPEGVIIDVLDTTVDRGVAYGVVESYYLAHPDTAGFCSVDTTGSPVAATFIENNDLFGEVFSAGFDLTAEVVQGLKNGSMAFTVDQHPYAEGFLSMMQLYLWSTLGIAPSWVNTGGHIVTGADVETYGLEELVEEGYR